MPLYTIIYVYIVEYTIIYYYIVEYTRIHSRLISYNDIAPYTMQSKPVEGRDAYGGTPPLAFGVVPYRSRRPGLLASTTQFYSSLYYAI